MSTHIFSQNKAGFTVVELVVAIAVLAILAVISIASYGAIRDQADYSTIASDMQGLNAAVEEYYNENGSYPNTSNSWRYRARDGADFIAGLREYYGGPLPDVTSGSKTSSTNNTYIYKSSGASYKLMRLHQSSLPSVEDKEVPSNMRDPNYPNDRWGYWSDGDAGY